MPVQFHRLQLVLIVTMAWMSAGMVALAGGVDLNSREQVIFNHMAGDSGQQRPFLQLDPVLCSVARARASDMGRRGYYDHTDPDGHGPNWWVEHAGYPLPAGYDQSASGNNIESIAAGYTDPDDTWQAWMDSPPHKQHLLATNSFFADQTSVGIGVVTIPGSDWGTYWVVITAPPDGPSVNISSPPANARLAASQVTLRGTTSGAPVAASVQASLDGTNWTPATGVANWSVTLDGLAAGPNLLHVRSLDAVGKVLDEATRTVRHVVLAPLTVQTAGAGTVTEGFAGTTQREVGHGYTITAKPAAGWLFDSWAGGVSAAKPTLAFTMSEGLVLTANFIPNPFIAAAGRFTGLFVSGDLHGLVRLNLDASGVFTSRVSFDGGGYLLAGKFDPRGETVISRELPGGGTFTMSLRLDTTGAAPQFTGTITDGNFTADLVLESLGVPGTGPNIHAGRYTLVLPALGDSTPTTPDGDSITTLTVGAHGAATLAGTLADGTALDAGGTLTAGGDLVLYVPLYGGDGVLAGVLHFRNTGTTDIDGSLFWSKPVRPKAAVCRDGFAITTTAIGSRYTPPAAGQPALDVATVADNTLLALGAGDFSTPMHQAATLATNNTVTFASPVVSGLKVIVQAATGHFAGTFVNPADGAPTRFHGIILQKQNAGFGFFLGTAASGYATFVPAVTQ